MSGNLLINSGVALNFQSATYELVRSLSPGVTYTFSMSGWHGGNDWDSNFGVYGITDSGSEVLLSEASYNSTIRFYWTRFVSNATYSYITVKSMKIHNNFNYQINWAVLNEGTYIWSVHTEPVLRDIRRLYYGQDEVMKRYVGSDLAHLVEWQRMTRMETIPFSTSRYNDANRYIGEEVITQQGVNGWTEYVWTTEVVNGVRTGNKTSELVGQFQAPRQQQIAVGTKPAKYFNDAVASRAHMSGQPNAWAIRLFTRTDRPLPTGTRVKVSITQNNGTLRALQIHAYSGALNNSRIRVTATPTPKDFFTHTFTWDSAWDGVWVYNAYYADSITIEVL